jgi:hypothetical protein
MVQAVALVLRHPTVFPLMGMMVSAIYLIPYVGGLVMLILGPALIAGSVIAARDAVGNGRPAASQLFALFQDQERTRDGIKLCIPLVVGKVLSSLILGIAFSRALLRAGLDMKALQTQPEAVIKALQDAGGSLFGWVLVALVILLVAWGFTVLAISRVALDRAEPFKAMRESIRLTRQHVGAWLLAGLFLLLAVFVLSMPLLLGGHLLLAQIVINIVVYSILGPFLYLAWHDLCQPQPPDNRATPPQPSGTLEA